MGLKTIISLILALAVTTAATEVANGAVRLAGGDQYYCGRREVFFDGKWITSCGRELETVDANRFCRDLGFARGGDAKLLPRNDTGDNDQLVWFGKLECLSSDFSSECTGGSFLNNSIPEGYSVVHLCCDPRPLSLPVRLVCPPCTGKSQCRTCPEKLHPAKRDCRPQAAVSGIVEVMVDGKWGPVAADGWDANEANVACGQLGYPAAYPAGSAPPVIDDIWPQHQELLDSGLLGTGSGFSGSHSLQQDQCVVDNLDTLEQLSDGLSYSLLNGLECSGTESELLECNAFSYSTEPNPSRRVAAVRCGFSPHFNCHSSDKTIRVRGGAAPWKGRVEMHVNRQWGTVCENGFTGVDGNVVCRSLGYGTVKSISGYGRGVGKIHYSNIRCSGRETKLRDCSKTTDVSGCNHANDIGIECNVPDCHNCSLTYNVAMKEQGNVMYPEVFGRSGWGLLCNNSRVPVVTREVGDVICRQTRGEFFNESRSISTPPRNYNGTFYSGNIQCSESANYLSECSVYLNRRSSCTDGYIIIFCSSVRADLVPDLKRLKDSLKSQLALVELAKYLLDCAAEEGCLSRRSLNSYNRKLLRFDSLVWNYGLADFHPVAYPSDWEYHECHYHYHSMEEFAHYNIYYHGSNRKASDGHKASFCLMDSVCEAGTRKQYECRRNSQAISVNCGDLYSRDLDCQWVDITGLYNGNYKLEVAVNPLKLGLESDYRNNNATCSIAISRVVPQWSWYPQNVLEVTDCWLSDH